MADDFDVSFISTKVDSDTTVVTSFMTAEEIKKNEDKILSAAMNKYESSKQYSVHTTDSTNSNTLTIDYIDELANGIHTNLKNLVAANQLLVKYVDEDGSMGYAYSVIRANTPTNYTMVYDNTLLTEENENKIAEIKALVNNFNKNVKIERLIRESISTAYLEGNVPIVLRITKNGYAVDFLPLDIAYPSGYKFNGDPILEVDVNALKTKLQKTYKKTRKNKAIYFENIAKEIEANFNKEILDAFKANEQYARIDANYGDCITVNSLGRKFGVSPLFRALRPLVVLNNIESADVSDSKARSKKIIFQKLRKELLGQNGEKKGLAEQALAHDALTQALKTNLCAYTAPAFVESLEFVSSKANNDDASKQLGQYMTKYLQALGIDFIDTEVGNYAGVNVSVTQIIRMINCIKSEVERVLNKFYVTLLASAGYDPNLAPTIEIEDAESMELSMRIELAKFVYGTLNASRETSFKLAGLNLNDEKIKRETELAQGLDEVFTPRKTAYTVSGDDDNDSSGRPQSNNDKGKQNFDKNYNKNK